MNLILLFEEDFAEGRKRARLGGRRLNHVRKVHRANPGDRLCVGVEGGLVGRGTVEEINANFLEMDVLPEHEPPAPLPLTLLLALPRPKVLRRVLFSATALGVKRIFLINSYRVEKSYWQSPVLDARSIREELIRGLEQARDTVLPEVFLRDRFRPFVEDELPEIAAGTLKVVAHPGAHVPCPRKCGAVTLAIGPEGGFIPYEIEKFRSAGFSAVNLNDRILPVEAAVPFAISRLF